MSGSLTYAVNRTGDRLITMVIDHNAETSVQIQC